MIVSIVEHQAFDAAKVSKTPEGFLRAAPLVARTGIQIYKGVEFDRPQVDTVRVYRPESEVFSADSLKSFAHRPMTNDHPSEMVDARNWRKFAVGQIGDEVLRDGDRIRVPLVIMDGATVADIETGKRELSMGYTMDLDWTAGTSDKGEPYDAIAKNIRCNHCAVVDTARGGPELRIGDQRSPAGREEVARDREERTMEQVLKTIAIDGLSVQVTDIAAQAFDRYKLAIEKQVADGKAELLASAAKITQLTADNAKLVTDHATALGAKDAQVVTLTKEVADLKAAASPAALDARVKDRAGLFGKAKALMPTVTLDGKTDGEIRRQVVDSRLGALAKDRDDGWIAASFDTMTATASPGQTFGRDLATATVAHSSMDAAAQAYDKSVKATEDAWKTPVGAAAN